MSTISILQREHPAGVPPNNLTLFGKQHLPALPAKDRQPDFFLYSFHLQVYSGRREAQILGYTNEFSRVLRDHQGTETVEADVAQNHSQADLIGYSRITHVC